MTDVTIAIQAAKQFQQLAESAFILGQLMAKTAVLRDRLSEQYEASNKEAGAMLFLVQLWERTPHVIPPVMQEFLERVRKIAVDPESATVEMDPAPEVKPEQVEPKVDEVAKKRASRRRTKAPE